MDLTISYSTGNQHCLKSLFYKIIIINFTNQMLIFDERGKLLYPAKNLSGQSREPTNSIRTWNWVRKSNPGHILVEGKCFHHKANPATAIKALKQISSSN